MIEPKILFDLIKGQGIRFFTGVPDSLLKDFCAYVTDNAEEGTHIIAANEGNAIGLASGWFLGLGEPALVYMQNSGIGNAINPLMSLADPDVYSIPMLLVIGWRGEPGIKDEPQHVKQGRIMPKLLESLEIPFYILDTTNDPKAIVSEACSIMNEGMRPVALLVRTDTFSPYKLKKIECSSSLPLSREDAIKCLIKQLRPEDTIVSTTGKTSRELYEYREDLGVGHNSDFLTVGSMGHTLSIASGIALSNPRSEVYCLDGDGSVLMHMGSLAIVGNARIKNLTHVVLNNGAHDSVGGQPTVGLKISLTMVAASCGYTKTCSVSREEEIDGAIRMLRSVEGTKMLEIKVRSGARSNLGRPKMSPITNRDIFMERLKNDRLESNSD